jgi:ribosome maturation factor RimP
VSGKGGRSLLTKNDIWQLLRNIVNEEGLELFDVDYPVSRSGVLRVYLSRPPGAGSVGLDDCARVSKRISGTADLDEFLGQACTLEVSSPGINRRLTRAEHFEGAVGERVKVTFLDVEKAKRSVTGTLVSVDDLALEVKDEKLGQAVRIARMDIETACVDFLFTK